MDGHGREVSEVDGVGSGGGGGCSGGGDGGDGCVFVVEWGREGGG